MRKRGHSVTVLDQLRQAIERDGRTLYAIAKAAGCTPEMLYRFVNKERDIRGATLARLCVALGLELTSTKGE